MKFFYIDESGNTGAKLDDKEQAYLFLGSTIVDHENIRLLEEEIKSIGFKHFGDESRNTDFEFHGDDLYNGRNKYFKKLNLDKRFNILDELYNIVLNSDVIKIGYVGINKKQYFANLLPQQTAFMLLIERVEAFLKSEDTHGLLVADENEELQQKLIDHLEFSKTYKTNFGYKSVQINRIVDSVHFVESKNNHLIQLSDVICYIIRKGYEADKYITEDYKQSDAYKGQTLDSYIENYPNRGKKYFALKYTELSKKGFAFSKIF